MEDANQKKKMILGGIIATIIVFIVVLVLLIVLMAQESAKTKIIFGGKTYKTRTVEMTSEDGKIYKQKNITYENKELPILLTTSDGKDYYCIETLSTMSKYKYNKGAYGELDENTNKCYIDNGGEYVTFSTETDSISKNIKTSSRYEGELEGKETNQSNDTEDEELFSLDKPVIKFVDGKLYASYDAITQGFNMSIIINESQITIYTLEDLVSSFTEYLSSKGYTLTKNFRNQRALYKGLAVAGQNDKYGVIELSGEDYNEVISVKYDTVEYVQSIGEFIVSSNSMYGMIAPGNEKPTISLKYENIQLLDAKKELYIVEFDKKFGVVNSNGDVVVPVEYDQIGLNDVSIYKAQGISNKYLISDKFIPVVKNNVYGLFDTDGYITVKTNRHFLAFGCENPAKLIDNTSAMPTLIVPLAEGLDCTVYLKDSGYGIIAPDGSAVTEAYYTAIYYMKVNGKITYYFNKVNNNQIVTLDELIRTEQVKSFIDNFEAKKKTKEQLEKDTEQEKNDIEKENSGEFSAQDIAINNAKEVLQEALNSISRQYQEGYQSGKFTEPLINYIHKNNLIDLMEGYNIDEVDTQNGIKIIFSEDSYKYEAQVTDELEVFNINVI